MLKINLDKQEYEGLKVLCDYLFFDQFKDNASFPRFEQLFGILTQGKGISLQQVFKEICGEKKKYITFPRFICAYLTFKNSPGSCSLDFKNFFSYLMKTVLKSPSQTTGIDTEKSKKYTSANFKTKECVTSLSVLSGKDSTIKGMIVEYDDFFKTKLYDKKQDDELIKKLELKLGVLDEAQASQKKISQLLFRDSITHVFGSYSNKLEFIGFKCRSGKIEFVGKPVGEAFLYGESNKQFHYLKMQVFKGIISIQPFFIDSPRQNSALKKELEDIDEDYLTQDVFVHEEGHLASMSNQDDIDKFLANPVLNDDHFFNQTHCENDIRGSHFSEVLDYEPRKWHGVSEYINTENADGGLMSIDDLLNPNVNISRKDDDEEDMKSKNHKKNNLKATKNDKKDKKAREKEEKALAKENKAREKEMKKETKLREKEEKKRRKIKKWDGVSAKSIQAEDILHDKDNYKRLMDKVNANIKSELTNENNKAQLVKNQNFYDNYLKDHDDFKERTKEVANLQPLDNLKDLEDNYKKAKGSKKKDKKEKKENTQRVLRSKGPSSNARVKSYYFESTQSNTFFDDFDEDDDDDFGYGFGNNSSNQYSYSYVQKSYTPDPATTKACAEKWRKITKRVIEHSGIKIISTIGAVIKAIHFVQNCEEEFFDQSLTLQQKIDLYELLEKNQNIINFLAQAPPREERAQTRREPLIEFDEDDLVEDTDLTLKDLPDIENKIKSIEAAIRDYPQHIDELDDLYTHLKKQKNIIIQNEEKRVQEDIIKNTKVDMKKLVDQEKEKRTKAMEAENKNILQQGLNKRGRGCGRFHQVNTEAVEFSSQPTPKKIYKNQKFIKSAKPWVDDIFKPEKTALCEVDRNGRWIRPQDVYEDEVDGWDKFEWCRPEEVFGSDEYQVFIDGIDHDDIIQGGLGDCYFLSAIAALCKFPKLVNKLFYIKEKTKEHCYGIYLCINGIWELILLDDLIPCVGKYNKNFAFSSSNGNELWVVLLEKAWAKINGNYARVIGGLPHEVFDVITEAYSEKIDITSRLSDQIWANILKGEQNGFIMTAGTSGDTQNLDIEEVGLVPGHAYTILRVVETKCNGKIVRLVHIRNPWGSGEWSGDWSDSSRNWSAALKQELQVEKAKDDGEFYMSYEDFIKYFCVLGICKLHDDYQYSIMRTRAKGAEKPFITKVSANENNVHTYLQIYQKNPRIVLKDGTYQQPVIAYMVLVDKDYNYIASTSACSMNICIEVTLNKGTYYLLTDINYRYAGQADHLHGYNITCFSSKMNVLNEETTIQPNVLLDKAVKTYAQSKITPSKESMGTNTYSSNKYSNDFPFVFSVFENVSNKDVTIKYSVECRGQKSFTFYCDPSIPEENDTATKVIKPKEFGIFKIMKYTPASMFNYRYESTSPMDESSMNDLVFNEEPEALDDKGELNQYIHQDKNGYLIGIENNSRSNLQLKLMLEGLIYVNEETEGLTFDLPKKGKKVFQLKLIPKYRGDLSFSFEYA